MVFQQAHARRVGEHVPQGKRKAAGKAGRGGAVPVVRQPGFLTRKGDGEQGGKLLSFLASPAGDKNDPPSDEESERLREAALAFLQELGVEDPAAAYAQYYQGVAVLNFAPRQDGVILYSDLVKVYMDRETGDVMGVDARNYRLNHRTRDLPKPRITEQQAAEYVSDSLQVEQTALALIPLTKQTEVLCYEFKATQNDTFYIVYINALTGEEEQIFQVINSEEGDLVV